MSDILGRRFKALIPQVEFWLDKLLPSENSPPDALHKAMRYSVFAGGKRLRPVLALESFRLAGGKGDRIFPVACALEMIHTYSLIHDDLPAMDDDDYRRGKPTCHKVFGEAIAILAGDALHALAFEVLAKYGGARVAYDVAVAIGTQGLVGGQVADILAEGKSVKEKDVRFIHQRKTAALITASLRVGAMLANADDDLLDILTQYGANVGLAFQITDDILGVVGDRKKLGKPIGSDEQHRKATYPRVVGIEKSRSIAEELVKRGKSILPPHRKFNMLREFADFVVRRTY